MNGLALTESSRNGPQSQGAGSKSAIPPSGHSLSNRLQVMNLRIERVSGRQGALLVSTFGLQDFLNQEKQQFEII